MDEQRPSKTHTCRCGEPATACYSEGQGTGHSEHVCACDKHTQLPPGLAALCRLMGW